MLTLTTEGIFLAAALYLAEEWDLQYELCTGRDIDGTFRAHDPDYRLRARSPEALRSLAGAVEDPRLRRVFERVADHLALLISTRINGEDCILRDEEIVGSSS